jgi:ATP-binding cassette subfamily F protein 3
LIFRRQDRILSGVIDFLQVSKAFGAQDVLREVCFRINPGERVGIVGPNGAGKSTVFGLIMGDLSPDRGSIELPSGMRIAHMHQEVSIHAGAAPLLDYAAAGFPELQAVREDIHGIEHRIERLVDRERETALRRLGELQVRLEALGGYRIRNEAEIALGGLGFAEESFAQPLDTFSGGWQMRAELARVLVSEPDILLLDEPTNYLDIPAVEWLQRFLRDFRGTLLLISHDRYLLNTLTSTTLEIANGEATRYPGSYERYVRERLTRLEQRQAAARNQARKREQAERFIERFRAKNTKASLVQSKIRQLERLQAVDIPAPIVSAGDIRLPDPERSGHEVLRLEDAGYTYDGARWVLRHVDLSIERGSRLALVGLNGTGKTTLLRILAGRLDPAEGKRVLGHKVQVGYQSQDFVDTMNPALTVFETVKRAGELGDQAARTLAGGFGFSGDAVDKPVQVLSGGEKVRLAFARLLCRPPNFLILDEPTTHLDIQARETLENALSGFAGTLCLVSHDIAFVRRVATQVLAMRPPGIRRYWGGYDYYRTKLAEQAGAAAAAAEKEDTARKPSARQEARRARASRIQERSRRRRSAERGLARMEEKIEKLEARQRELLDQLAAGKPDTGYEQANKELADLQQQINDATRRWEAYAMELDDLQQEAAATD